MAHFHPYLLGSPFVVITDHRPLVHLKNMKQTSGKISRWLHAISQYSFSVEYKPGRLHDDADALSRMCGATTISAGISKSEMRALQTSNEAIKAVISQLRDNSGRPPAEGRWREGAYRRYRQLWDQLQLGDDDILRRRRRLGARLDEVTVLVVPPPLVPSILRQVHDDPLSGHLGVNKTVDVLLERYYWPGFSADVERYIRECPCNVSAHVRIGIPTKSSPSLDCSW